MDAICFVRLEHIKPKKWFKMCNEVANYEDQGFMSKNHEHITDKDRKFKYNENYAYVLKGGDEIIGRVLDFMILMSRIEFFPYERVEYKGE